MSTSKSLGPQISVLMSVFNGSTYLRESIESILNQTYTDFEFIIINDCSTDNTEKIIEEYSHIDKRIVPLKNQENIGLTKSLNKGLIKARGKYIARQDDDDIALPERLEKESIFLENHKEYILVSCEIEQINTQGKSISISNRSCNSTLIAWHLLFHNHVAGHSQVMFRRKPVINTGGYCDTYRYSQDYRLWCQLIQVGKIAILPEVLQQCRSHESSISSRQRFAQEKYVLYQIQYNLKTLLGKSISLKEAQDIRIFWNGLYWINHENHSPFYFYKNQLNIEHINSLFKEAQKTFLHKLIQEDDCDITISLQTRISIGKIMLKWIKFPLNKRCGLMLKYRISIYACDWCPLWEIYISWLICILKSIKSFFMVKSNPF